MKNFLLFKTMITPVILQIVFWIGTILFIIFGLIDLISNQHYRIGVQMIVLGPIGLRVATECLLILFRIYNKLDDISKQPS